MCSWTFLPAAGGCSIGQGWTQPHAEMGCRGGCRTYTQLNSSPWLQTNDYISFGKNSTFEQSKIFVLDFVELYWTHSLLNGFILLVRYSITFTSEGIGIHFLLRKNFILWRWGWLPPQSEPPCPKGLRRNPVAASAGLLNQPRAVSSKHLNHKGLPIPLKWRPYIALELQIKFICLD